MTLPSTRDDSPQAPPVVKIPLYQASTQFRNWRYSPEQLSDIRSSLNNAAVAVIRSTFEAEEVYAFNIYLSIIETLHPARLVINCLFFDSRRGTSSCETLRNKNHTIMWPFSLSRGG